MCGTFRTEPAAPRTVFRDQVTPEVSKSLSIPVAVQAMTNVLIAFPEAYEAVLAEMRRLCPMGDRAP